MLIKILLKQDKSLLDNGIIKRTNDIYILNSKYKIGKITLKKDIALLELENIQKIFIELDKLNGAYTNDIVLAQMIFNPRSKTKAKVIKIIQRNNSKILCFVKDKKLLSIKDSIDLGFSSSLKQYNNGNKRCCWWGSTVWEHTGMPIIIG